MANEEKVERYTEANILFNDYRKVESQALDCTEQLMWLNGTSRKRFGSNILQPTTSIRIN